MLPPTVPHLECSTPSREGGLKWSPSAPFERWLWLFLPHDPTLLWLLPLPQRKPLLRSASRTLAVMPTGHLNWLPAASEMPAMLLSTNSLRLSHSHDHGQENHFPSIAPASSNQIPSLQTWA